MKLNATARREFVGTCGHFIAQGERLAMFRERALTSREAAHGGAYPLRKWCARCASGPHGSPPPVEER